MAKVIDLFQRRFGGGLSCADYELIRIYHNGDLPFSVGSLMSEHYKKCRYHASFRFTKKWFSAKMTNEKEMAARELVSRLIQEKIKNKP